MHVQRGFVGRLWRRLASSRRAWTACGALRSRRRCAGAGAAARPRSAPQFRELKPLQAAGGAAPNDPAPAIALATAYVRASRAEGDPRFLGYAQAALAPWWKDPEAPTAVLMLRATILQSRHEFDAAARRSRPHPAARAGKRPGGADARHRAHGAREICRGARRLRRLSGARARDLCGGLHGGDRQRHRQCGARLRDARAHARRRRAHRRQRARMGARRCWAKSRIAAATPRPNDISARRSTPTRATCICSARTAIGSSTSNAPPT